MKGAAMTSLQSLPARCRYGFPETIHHQPNLRQQESRCMVSSGRVSRRVTRDLIRTEASAVLERTRDVPGIKDFPRAAGSHHPQPFASIQSDFDELINTQDLDRALQYDTALQTQATWLQQHVSEAINVAYSQPMQPGGNDKAEAAHLLLQRILYKINRLVFFWFDDLQNYSNERSIFLAILRDAIEAPWQEWELQQLPEQEKLSPPEIQERIRSQAAYDVDPEPSEDARYMARDMSFAGYKYVLAVGSVDGLVEASRQSRVCAGVANEVSCAVFCVLMEEYGTGRYSKKHSTFYAKMMRELGLSDCPEDYFELVPWQSLAAMNHNFLLTERRRHYLRYLGGLTFFEVNGPSVYRTYLAAAQNLGLSDDASGYWALHIKEDERHGRQMVEDVAVPLVDMYPKDANEVLLGYNQEKFMGERAGAAVLKNVKRLDQEGVHNLAH